jgi:hypothetical protein
MIVLCEPIFHRSTGLVDPGAAAVAHFFQMFRHHFGDGVRQCLLLKVSRNPCALRASEYGIYAGFISHEGAVIEIGRVMDVAGLACSIHLHIKHLLGNRSSITILKQARVLDGVFQVKEYARHRAGIAIVHQNGAAPQKIAPRSSVRSSVASSRGWPGQTKAASGSPCGAIKDFSNAIRS